MYAFLLALGAAITAAGIALVASAVSLQDRALDASAATPGIIAIIGGCVLVGLSLIVRALLRVERALTARSAAAAARAAETSADGSTERADEPRIPFPAKANTAQADSADAAAADQAPAEASAETSPGGARIDAAPVVDAGDVSLLPKEPARADEGHADGHAGLSNGKLNGTSHTTTAPRLAGGPDRRPQPKNSIFDTLWPKASSSPHAPGKPAPQPAAAAGPTQPVPVASGSAATPAGASQAPAVSILKSGVVEGMAYTLYSDGSIEAQLPGGTMRFSSITELRSHIEQNA